jgi:hypothetical protein
MKNLALGLFTLVVIVAAAFAPSGAAAAPPDDDWKYKFSIYGWLPDIRGTLNQEDPETGNIVKIDADTLLDNLDMTAMLAFEARRGERWSLLADMIYLDLGAEESGAVTVPDVPDLVLDAEARLDLKGWIVSLGGARRVIERERGTLGVTFAVRYFNMDSDLDLRLEGPIPPELSQAAFADEATLWDGVVGIRGQLHLGKHWYVPYHLDAGTGESDFTWQAMAGIGYRFRWGNVLGVYRGLGYEQGSRKPFEDFTFAGPALAVVLRF